MDFDDTNIICPSCGSAHINWRVRHDGRHGRSSGRTFVWTCRACSTTWVETADGAVLLEPEILDPSMEERRIGD